jgi:mono/diheme cytochrome c family protein
VKQTAKILAITMLFVAAALLVVRSPVQAQQAKPEAKPVAGKTQTASGNVEKGKQLYTSFGCYQCHGREGQGGSTGPRLGPKPIPLEAFITYSQRPSANMPPYTAKVVSEADWANIYAFVKSLPEPPAVKDIPALNH